MILKISRPRGPYILKTDSRPESASGLETFWRRPEDQERSTCVEMASEVAQVLGEGHAPAIEHSPASPSASWPDFRQDGMPVTLALPCRP